MIFRSCSNFFRSSVLVPVYVSCHISALGYALRIFLICETIPMPCVYSATTLLLLSSSARTCESPLLSTIYFVEAPMVFVLWEFCFSILRWRIEGINFAFLYYSSLLRGYNIRAAALHFFYDSATAPSVSNQLIKSLIL